MQISQQILRFLIAITTHYSSILNKKLQIIPPHCVNATERCLAGDGGGGGEYSFIINGQGQKLRAESH
jgi:hypothetical protein